MRIKLMPKETFGRRMQYAFLSMAPEDSTVVRYETDIVEFDDVESYVKTVELALEAILGFLYDEGSQARCRLEPVHGIDCCKLDRGPTLYTSGISDSKILRDAGLDKCMYPAAKGGPRVAWTHAAVSYAVMVLERGEPLRGGDYRAPNLAKASLFTNVRGVGVATESKEIRVDLDAMGTVLLGGAIAFLGSHRLGHDERLEFFLLPDSPTATYSVLRSIMAGKTTGNLAGRVSRLIRDFNVGFEQALALITASLLYENEEKVSKLGVGRLSASGRLYTVSPGQRRQKRQKPQRPMIRSGTPLSTLLYEAYEKDTISAFNWFTNAAEAASRSRRDRIDKGVVASCLNYLYLQAQSPCATGFMYDCARILAELSRRNDELGKSSSLLVWRLKAEYSRMAWRCRSL